MATEAASENTILAADHWPVPWASTIREWLGDVEMEIPAQTFIPTSGLLGILASHRSREEPLTGWWELAMESALSQAKLSQRAVFFSSAAPYADRLRHACERFGVPHLELRCSNNNEPLPTKTVLLRYRGNPLPDRENLPESRLEDRAIAILSHQLFGLHVRHGGKVARLLQARLAEPSINPGSTMIAMRDRAASRQASETLLDFSRRGAVLWMLCDPSANGLQIPLDVDVAWGCRARTAPATWMPIGRASRSLIDESDFLIHFTRGRRGAWPEQSQSNLFDEAIRLQWIEQQRPLQTLNRILTTQRLIASSYLRRGSVRTVCFTAQSIRAMLDRRGFQSHLGRWDWEPYGIAIRRTWLSAQGARPVRYLHPREIAELAPEEQAFTQPHYGDDRHRDWSIEQEWRVQGDIRLCQIPTDQAFLFVNRRSEAASLANWSRWPIVYLSSED